MEVAARRGSLMFNICTFLWGDKYGVSDVAKLARGVRRHLSEPYRFICLTDDILREPIEGVDYQPIPNKDLLNIPGCFARLCLFDPHWQFIRDIGEGERIVCIDLDTVITGDLFPLFNRDNPFLILTGANAANPCPYNGSLWLLHAGYRPDVWSDFTLEKANAAGFYSFPDDQGWMAHKIPGVAGWPAGSRSGVYAFKKPAWPKGDDLPADARMVVFPGWRRPARFTDLEWVREHWR